MNLRYCPFDDLTVRSLEGLGMRLGRGAAVDLDQVIGQDAAGEPFTLEQALGEYAAAFTTSPIGEPTPLVTDPQDAGDDADAGEE